MLTQPSSSEYLIFIVVLIPDDDRVKYEVDEKYRVWRYGIDNKLCIYPS